MNNQEKLPGLRSEIEAILRCPTCKKTYAEKERLLPGRAGPRATSAEIL